MQKIAFIVQRYGLEVNGGAEYHARILAERLAPFYDIEILTTCAKDYSTWANAYEEGSAIVNGVKVRRFKVAKERNQLKAHRISRKLRKRTLTQRFLQFIGILSAIERKYNLDKYTEEDCLKWSIEQGPYSPDLISYLQAGHNQYDALVFFTYLYFPTTYGLAISPEKSILIPTAHEESSIYLPIFKSVFKLPKAILYNTNAEKQFVNKLFNNEDIYSTILGIGIENPSKHNLQASNILGIDQPYLIYIGRINRAKGCELMIRHFIKYQKLHRSSLKLVLVGESTMKIMDHSDIITMGFVSEETKQALLEGALALVIPSFYESLSLVTLEAMAQGIPVLANKKCEVLEEHILASKAGFLFQDYKSFAVGVDKLQVPSLALNALKENGKEYVRHNYQWPVIINKFKQVVDYVSAANGKMQN